MDSWNLKWRDLGTKERIVRVAGVTWVLLLFLAGGIRLPGDSGAPPPGGNPTTETWATQTSIALIAPARRSYNGVAEGDIIDGELTFYCRDVCCNGKWAGTTADGTVLDDNTEPIASANWLPFDSIVAVDGVEYRIADRGGSGLERVGRLDIYELAGHAAALARGRVKGARIKIIYIAEEVLSK